MLDTLKDFDLFAYKEEDGFSSISLSARLLYNELLLYSMMILNWKLLEDR